MRQFDVFLTQQTEMYGGGVGEVKFEVPQEANLFKRLYCVDFVSNNDGALSVVEMQPDRQLSVDSAIIPLGDMDIHLSKLIWDNVTIDVPTGVPQDIPFEAWFDKWFDLDDKSGRADERFSYVIHSLR